jgi:flavin-dependent dehydrogenase
VLIVEKEKFPRDHVGESQLPQISDVLQEMGCWDKVEAADFPIKIGATYRWGTDPNPWDFNFIKPEQFKDEQRPAKFEGQRRQTAFQVDRAKYDEILLRHAEEMGCLVREETAVVKVDVVGDRITALHLRSQEQITARYYIDASGHIGYCGEF